MNKPKIERILVAGASSRAVASMARAAGLGVLGVLAADFFSDRDTQELADCRRADSFDRIPECVANDPFDAWLPAGGIENHPEVIRTLNERAPMLGPDPNSISRCRDFRGLDKFLKRLPPELPRLPETIFWDGDQAAVSNSHSIQQGRPKWIVKPTRGAGGHSIRFASPDQTSANDSGLMTQRFIPGQPFSGLFVAGPKSRCELLELSTPFRAESSPHPFRYEGSISGFELPEQLVQAVSRSAQFLANEFSITGLFGIDFVLSSKNIFLLEINPRIPASAEISRRSAADLFQLHVNATTGLPYSIPVPTDSPRGKAVIYNDGPDIVICAQLSDLLMKQSPCPIQANAEHEIQFADIPSAGEIIRTGHPMFTVFALAETPAEVDRQLQSQLHRQLHHSRSIDSVIE